MSGELVGVGIGGFVYSILALQVRMGLPPFYIYNGLIFFSPSFDEIREVLILVFPPFIGVAVSMVLMGAGYAEPGMLLMGVTAIWGGLRVRQSIRSKFGLPLPWCTNLWTLRWPLLLFDLWTGAFALGAFALIAWA